MLAVSMMARHQWQYSWMLQWNRQIGGGDFRSHPLTKSRCQRDLQEGGKLRLIGSEHGTGPNSKHFEASCTTADLQPASTKAPAIKAPAGGPYVR